jgi:cell division protein FtsB
MNKNNIIAALGVLFTALAIIIGGWVQVNSRISVLEIQVKEDHEMFMAQSKKIDEISNNVNDIKNQITEMRGEMKLKQDKFKMQPYEPEY